MAKPTTIAWSEVTIWAGNGATPEVFSEKVCGLTSKGFDMSADTSDSVVPDCTDPNAGAFVERVIRSLSGGITGSGFLATEIYAFYRDWFLSKAPKNARVAVGITPAGYYAGSFLVTGFNTTGNMNAGKAEVSITLVSAGDIVWTASS